MRTASTNGTPSATTLRNGAVERQRAAGKLSFGITRHAVFHGDLKISEAVISVGHAGGGDAVAYEQHGVESLGAEQHLNRRPGHVDAIGDHFGGDFRDR